MEIQKKLSSFKNAGKLANSQPNFNTEKNNRIKTVALNFFLNKSYLNKKSCKVREKRAIEAQCQLLSARNHLKFRSKTLIEILVSQIQKLGFNCSLSVLSCSAWADWDLVVADHQSV